MGKNKIIKNIRIITTIYIVLILLLGVRVFFLQVKPTEAVQGETSNSQIEYTSQIKYNILDTNNKDMLNHKKKYVMVIDSKPFKLNNYEGTLEDLLALNFIMKSEDPKFNYTDIMKEIGKSYYTVTEETYNKIQKLNNIKGIYTYVYDELDIKEGWRPENIVASVDENAKQLGDFEKKVIDITKDNKYPTESFHLNDEAVYNVNEVYDGQADNKNIKLTIDSEWSDKIREVLMKDDYSFLKNVGVVLLEADTGKIKAMVQKDETEANVNLAIGQMGYEPGSIFKILTEAVALDKGLINTTDTFTCEGKICTKNKEPYAHGTLTVEQALEVSCNDIFAKIGSLSSYETMLKYTTNLGLYQKVLGISGENREEAAGVMPTPDDGISNFSIGQCVMVTPLQIAGAINAVVNDGVYVKPRLIEAVLDKDNNVIEETQPEERRVFSSTTAKLVQNSMTDVIWQGTGYEGKVEGILQGGKTGTSTGMGGSTNHGWFAGYFQMNNKMYTLVVIAPNIGDKHPDGRELGGGNTGAPIYRDVINSLLSLQNQ